MRNILGLLTAAALSVQHADSCWEGARGRFDSETTHTGLAYPEIRIWWKTYRHCEAHEVQINDSLERSKSFDLREESQPLVVLPFNDLPITHWMNYTLKYRYACHCPKTFLGIELPFYDDENESHIESVETGGGPPLPVLDLEVFTNSSSAEVHWKVTREILCCVYPANATVVVVAQLLSDENYHSEPRRIHPPLRGPLELSWLSPSVVYTVTLVLEINGFQSESRAAKFIVDVLEEHTVLEYIAVINCTPNSTTLEWGNIKEKKLATFITGYEVKWKAVRRNATWNSTYTTERSLIIEDFTEGAKYDVVIHAFFTCGDRTIRGVPNKAFIATVNRNPDSWRLVVAGVGLAFSSLIVIVVIVVIFLRLRSNYRERKLMERAKFLERTSCFSTNPALARRARYGEPQTVTASPPRTSAETPRAVRF